MKKQSKKTKTDTSKKRGRPAKKAQKQAKKNQPEEQQPETEQPEDKIATEEEQHNHEITQSQTQQPQPEETQEPQNKVADDTEPKILLTQSAKQALRTRFSFLTPDYFEGTKEDVLQRLSDTTKTDINELRTITAAYPT